MIFLAPALLLGAAAIAAPIVLHLVMRRQPKLMVFPAMQFLKARSEANRRRFQLRHLLLLLLRALLLGLAALAMARPLIPSSGFFAAGQSPVAAIMVIDTSIRMDAAKPVRGKKETRLDAAKARASAMLASLPEGSQVWVFESRKGQAVSPMDPTVATKRVERLTTVQDALPLSDAIAMALDRTGKDSSLRRELYVFTDLNAADWSPAALDRWIQPLGAKPTIGVVIIDVGLEAPINRSLGDLTISNQNPTQQDEVRIGVSLSALGETQNMTVELVTLDSQGGEQLRGQSVAAPSSAVAAAVELPPLRGLPPGTTQGFVRVIGDDDLEHDNQRAFTLVVRPAASVLICANEPTDDNAWLISEAIAPSELRAASKSPYELTLTNYAAIEPELLATHQVLILHDPGDLTDAAWNSVYNFAAAGGGVGVNLGPSVTDDFFNRAAAQRVLPGRLERVWRAGAVPWYFAPDDYSHPLLSEFPLLSAQPPWTDFPIRKFWQISAEDWQNRGVSVVARNSSGKPALIESVIGRGKLLVFTSPLGDATRGEESWNDLLNFTGEAAWPGFVLAQKMVDYLAGGADAKWNYRIGETAQLRVPAESSENALLALPTGETIQHVLNTSRRDTAIASTGIAGNYQLRSGGEAKGWSLGFSVNVPAEATELRRATLESIAASLKDIPHRFVSYGQDWERKGGGGAGDWELFGPLTLTVLILFMLEYVVSNRFYASEPVNAAASKPRRAA